MIQPASLLESFHSGIMPGSSAGQKKAPICTSTCAAQTIATSLAGDRANVAEPMAMTGDFNSALCSGPYHISIMLEIPLTPGARDDREVA